MAGGIVHVIAGPVWRELEGRVSSGLTPSPHLVARRDLERYYALLAEGLRRVDLTTGEASLVVDVLNGTILDGRTAAFLWAEIEDGIRLDSLDKKWSIDGKALVEKAKAWGLAESLAVSDAAERYWASLNPDEPIEDGLRRVGLVRAAGAAKQ